jgi:hypothetical protein
MHSSPLFLVTKITRKLSTTLQLVMLSVIRVSLETHYQKDSINPNEVEAADLVKIEWGSLTPTISRRSRFYYG